VSSIGMRRRLVLVALATTAMVAIAFLIPLAILVRTVARNQAIIEAERIAQSLTPVLALGAQPDRVEAVLPPSGPDVVTVYLADGTVVGDARPPDDAVRLARDGKANFSVAHGGTVDVYTPVVRADGTDVVRVTVPRSELREGVLQSWVALTAVAVALVAVAVLVADRLAASIRRPVQALADTARQLSAGEAEARVEPAGPAEVADVGRAVNELADRIDDLRAAEREMVADLSHRLRTPLTALRLDAEGLDGPAAERVAADVSAMEDAVNQLIAEARAPSAGGGGTTDMVAVAAERSAFWAVLAEDQHRPWTVTLAPGPLRVALPEHDVAAALDALIGNVFAHTPEGAPVRVDVAVDRTVGGGLVVLAVDDGGPGIDGDHVVTRGVSGSRSTGLGLDIARRTATAAGGVLKIGRAELGGARVELRLPRR